MVKYKRVDAANGRTMWFVDGKMTGANMIPEDVVRDLQSTGTLDLPEGEDTPGEPQQQSPEDKPREKAKPAKRTCLVCGEPGTHSKYVSEITVYLCDEHYAKLTTGEIVNLAREKELI